MAAIHLGEPGLTSLIKQAIMILSLLQYPLGVYD